MGQEESSLAYDCDDCGHAYTTGYMVDVRAKPLLCHQCAEKRREAKAKRNVKRTVMVVQHDYLGLSHKSVLEIELDFADGAISFRGEEGQD